MIQFQLQNGRVKLITDRSTFDDIKIKFTFENSSSKYSGANPFWGAITDYGSFKIGLFKEVYSYTKTFFNNEKIEVDSEILKRAFPKFEQKYSEIKQPKNTTYIYRDYQSQAILNVIKYGRGLVIMPTRSGKTLVMYGLAENIKMKKMLIVVPNIQLVKQFKKDFIEYGWDPNEISAFSGFEKNPNLNATIIVANSQYLLKHYKELGNFDTIFIDEVHTTFNPNTKIGKLLSQYPTLNKVGFTGTLPDDKINEYKIKGEIGSICYSLEITSLQDKNYLANVKIYPIQFIHKKKVKFIPESVEDFTKRFIWETDIINDNKTSNEKIVKIASKLKGNTLILFDRVEHGKKLFELLESDNKCYVDGSVKLDEREEIREKMSKKNNCITVANTKCFSTGITLKQIQNIVFSMNGKGTTKIIQSIGRGLEKNKNHINLIDIFHNYKYSSEHFEERCILYKKFYNLSILKSDIKEVII
jgi:superfamily II DNA or RNA helicase